MKLVSTSAFLAALVLSAEGAFGHGGAYRAPGDTVAAGGGSSPSGGTTSGGGSVGPSAPGAPAPSGAAGGATSGTPSAPGGPTAASSGSSSTLPDYSRWQAWWGFNKDAYLDVKARIHFSDILTGSDEAFLGTKRALTRDELRPSPETVRARIVPALIEALANERSNDITSGVLIALAKIGDPLDATGSSPMAEEIGRFLADSNQEVAESAAVSLGILGNEHNVALLREIFLGDADALRKRGIAVSGSVSERTRAFAAYGLGLIGYRAPQATREAIVATLVDWMRREGATQRQSEIPVGCTVALGLVPLPSDPQLAAPTPGAPIRRPARVVTREEQVLWLLAELNDRSLPLLVRAQAPISIGRLTRDLNDATWVRQLAARELVARLDEHFDEELELRTSCVIALGQIGDCDDDAVDREVRRALAGVGDEFHEQQLAHFALISLAQVAGRPGTGRAPLAGLDGKHTPRHVLLDELGEGASATRCYAALALGVLERSLAEARRPPSADTLAALRCALGEARSPDEVGALAIALGIARDVSARRLLREKLEETSDHDARGYVAVALGLVGDRSSIGRIQELVAKSRFQPELLRQAALALGLLGDKRIVPQLIEMLQGAASLSSQAAIASALGLIGDARSIDPLLEMLRDDERCSDLARAFAAVALGICADKEQLPWNAKVATNSNYRANTSTLYSPDTGTGILDIL